MTTLVLYIRSHEVYRQEIRLPEHPACTWMVRTDLRKAYVEYKISQIKVLFARQLSRGDEFNIVLEVKSKLNETVCKL